MLLLLPMGSMDEIPGTKAFAGAGNEEERLSGGVGRDEYD